MKNKVMKLEKKLNEYIERNFIPVYAATMIGTVIGINYVNENYIWPRMEAHLCSEYSYQQTFNDDQVKKWINDDFSGKWFGLPEYWREEVVESHIKLISTCRENYWKK